MYLNKENYFQLVYLSNLFIALLLI